MIHEDVRECSMAGGKRAWHGVRGEPGWALGDVNRPISRCKDFDFYSQ